MSTRTSSIASGEGENGTVLTRASVATTPSRVACWLLSDRASYASGGVYVVDGAYMAG